MTLTQTTREAPVYRTDGIPFLRDAVAQWRKAKASELARGCYGAADDCENAAQSLELEISTGLVHCSCLVPIHLCPKQARRDMRSHYAN